MNKYFPWNWCKPRLTPQAIEFDEVLQRLLDSDDPVPFSNKVYGYPVWYIDFKNGVFMNAAKKKIVRLKLDVKESSPSLIVLRTLRSNDIDYKIFIPTRSTHQLELLEIGNRQDLIVGTLYAGILGELSLVSHLYH